MQSRYSTTLHHLWGQGKPREVAFYFCLSSVKGKPVQGEKPHTEGHRNPAFKVQ